MKLARPYLIFLNPLYGLITRVRNWLFDIGLLRSKSFPVPTIAIGNLSVGGTGKTPHTEYLIGQLVQNYRIAMLSRGYGRQSKGYQEAGKIPLAALVGDEPAQIKNKFPEIQVVVDGNRVRGMENLLAAKLPPDVVVLDDAYQHRYLQAGFYILLTSYDQPYTQDFLLPAGNLRESKGGANRAQIIVVSKCPSDLSEAAQKDLISELAPQPNQEVYFTTVAYSGPVGNLVSLSTSPFLLVTGIANEAALLDFLKENKASFTHKSFPDHHQYSNSEINDLITTAKALGVTDVLTTEKDFQRLPKEVFFKAGLSLSYLPIHIEFLNREAAFLHAVNNYIASNS